MPVELPYRPPCRVPSVYEWAPGLRLTDATSAGVGRSRISDQTDGNNVDRRREDGVQLIARAVLWPHVTLYRLTNGRSVAASSLAPRSCSSPPPGGGPASAAPPLAYVREGERDVLCASNGDSPHPSRLVPPPTRDQPGPDPGGRRASFCHRQDPDPSRARPAVPRFVEMYKGYAGQEDKTGRQIPLVLLTLARPNSTA
jgi:hypothetical protein